MIAVLGTVITFLIVLLRRDYENWEQTRPWARLVSLSTGQSYQLTQDTANVGVATTDLHGIKHQVALQQHDRVSRIHLSISRGGTVADWRSFYGTTVNGEWLAYGKSRKLDHGDILVLSGVELLVYQFIDWRPWQRYFQPHFPDETPLSGGAVLLDGHARVALPLLADAQDQQFVTLHDGKVGLTDHQTEDAVLIARRRVLSDHSPLTPQTIEARVLESGRVSQVNYLAIVINPGRKGCPIKKQISVLTLEPLALSRDRVTSWIKEGDRDLRQIGLPPNLETVLISESGGPHLSGPHGMGELLFNTGNGWLQVVPTRMAKVEEIRALCAG
jgi:hypothetical protein